MLTTPTTAGSGALASSCSSSKSSKSPGSPAPPQTLDFIIGIRTLPQLKCACRRQCPRDPRRATALFATLKEAFNQYKCKPMAEIPERYRPFFCDLRRCE